MTITDPLPPLIGTYAPEIVRAMNARHLLNQQLHWMRRASDKPNAHDVVARHSTLFWRTFWRAYHPALRDLVERVGMDAVTAERDLHWNRLEKGWRVPGERSDRLFAEVVTVLEVLEDALKPQGARESVSRCWEWRLRNAAGWLSDAEMVVQVSGVMQAAVDASEAIENATCASAIVFVGESPAVAQVG